jgi:hypothetical protein
MLRLRNKFHIELMRTYFVSMAVWCALLTSLPSRAAEIPAITVGTFKQEVRRNFTAADGLIAVTSVAVLDAKTVLAGTTSGLAQFADGRWTTVKGTAGASVEALAASKATVCWCSMAGCTRCRAIS